MECPICRTPTAWDGNVWRPFCSERCQLTDLGTWATEGYRLAGPSLTAETGLSEWDEEDRNKETD